jgi:hypothetical protein
MTRIIEKTLYHFDELPSEEAKEAARDWYRGLINVDEIADSDDWQEVAGILGIEFATESVRLYGGGTRNQPRIYWSGFNSQGDGASFEGSYSYAKGAPAKIREYAPEDGELHRIADELQRVQHRHFYQLTAEISRGPGSNFYSHSGTMLVEVQHPADRDLHDAVDAIGDLMRDFADWIYRQLEAQWEYLRSEESVDEMLRANEYEFDADGSLSRDGDRLLVASAGGF